ncbi:CvpA family protein, partial [Candidatus Gottesmanbacteria bacterium]|nr:CvpA family protein [Candidatus Gottesmanbacteria bacterium]
MDWLIFVVVCYSAIDGWNRGLFVKLANTLSFFLSLWIAVRYHSEIGAFIIEKFGGPLSWKDVIGYLLLALPVELVSNALLERQLRKIPQKFVNSIGNRWIGSFFSGANSLLFLAYLFLVVLSLPVRGPIKRDITNSIIGSNLVFLSMYYGGLTKPSLDFVTQEALNFVTIKPHSNERIDLNVFPTQEQLTVDSESEQRMIDLVNYERTKIGLSGLKVEEKLTVIARDHSRDMFVRRYFSHFSPEGHDVGYRAKLVGQNYVFIGENLAYAPDVE